MSTATYECSSLFTNTNFMTKKQPKDQDFEKVSRRLETKTQVSRTTTEFWGDPSNRRWLVYLGQRSMLSGSVRVVGHIHWRIESVADKPFLTKLNTNKWNNNKNVNKQIAFRHTQPIMESTVYFERSHSKASVSFDRETRTRTRTCTRVNVNAT